MAAVTESGSQITEFSGNVKSFVSKVTPSTADDTLTVDEFGTILGVFTNPAANPDANGNHINRVASVSGNVITFKSKKADGATDASTFAAFYVHVIGY